MRLSIAFILPITLVSACKSSPSPEGAPVTATAESPSAAPRAGAPTHAEVGKPAPDFELADLDGKKIRLSEYRGKVVVLEWFNPECPFVNASHTKGSLVGTAARHVKEGVVWLAINSAGPERQGYGVEKNRDGIKRFGLSHPVLLDESGRVGRSYGAKTTPHLFVIDAAGKLVYAGAIDNSPDGEGDSPSDGKLVNYVDFAVAAARDQKQPAVTETEPYGCSVKYAK